MSTVGISPSEAFVLHDLVTPSTQAITSRILAMNNGGSLTLFAFDEHQELSEHTAPFDALVMVLDGRLKLTIGGTEVMATAGTIVRMPAHVPHAVDAIEPSRMLLTMLRDTKAT
jgi:quercetin dioxygenase-like cupin family protein